MGSSTKLPIASATGQRTKAGEIGSCQSIGRLIWSAAGGAAVQIGSLLAPVVVVCLGIFVSSLESNGGRPVDRDTCDCSCWDGRFKGRHTGTRQRYKNVFFNIEPATAVLFIWTSLWVKLLGTGMERIYSLFTAGSLRYMALAPSLLMFYPLFYGAWTSWNYINEEWPLLLPSQLFFLATELLPGYCAFQLLNAQQEPTPAMATLSIAVSCAHIALALKEKVLWGFIWPEVHTANARDIMLMAGDITVLVFYVRALLGCKLTQQELQRQAVLAGGIAVGLVAAYLLLFSYQLD